MIQESMTFIFTSFCSYIQLDLGQLKVKNDFSWHGGEESDPSAVRLDVHHAEVFIGRKLNCLVSWPGLFILLLQ